MRALVVLLSAIACTVAEPPLLFRYDIPHYLYNHYALGHSLAPVLPAVRQVIPSVSLPLVAPHYAGIKSLYYNRDLIGQANYGHVEPGQTHHAVQDAFGNKAGGFSYYNAEGKLIQTSYIADANGYRVTSNDLPKKPVDTPEVEAAKAAHLAEHEKIKSRSRRDALFTPVPHIDYRIATPFPHAFPTTPVVPVVKPDGFLADTPEVAAAKSLHFAELEAAKARNYVPIAPVFPHFDYRYLPTYSRTDIPLVRPDGFLFDTPEVAAEKARHFAEVAKATAQIF